MCGESAVDALPTGAWVSSLHFPPFRSWLCWHPSSRSKPSTFTMFTCQNPAQTFLNPSLCLLCGHPWAAGFYWLKHTHTDACTLPRCTHITHTDGHAHSYRHFDEFGSHSLFLPPFWLQRPSPINDLITFSPFAPLIVSPLSPSVSNVHHCNSSLTYFRSFQERPLMQSGGLEVRFCITFSPAICFTIFQEEC